MTESHKKAGMKLARALVRDHPDYWGRLREIQDKHRKYVVTTDEEWKEMFDETIHGMS